MPPDQNKKSLVDKQPYIKRPLNAYMLWAQERRNEIAFVNPKWRNSKISKQMGAEWNLMTMEEKQPFINKAKRLREQHARDHPEFKYEYRSGNTIPYLLWSRNRRIEISFSNPELFYCEICEQMSNEWKRMTIEEKQPFIDEAKRLREQRMANNPEYKCSRRHKPKSIMSNQSAETQSQENSPCQCKCTCLELKGSRQELNPCDSVHNFANNSSLIQNSCPEPQYYNDDSPLDLSIRKLR